MNDKCGFAAVSRRDAIRFIAATPASGAVFATSLPGIASANTRALAGDTARRHPHGSARATQGLADLAVTHFEPLIGQTFSIGGEEATLTEVRRGPANAAPFRQQFALTFSAPRHDLMPSEILPVSHPAIGRHDLYVTRIGVVELEICFS